MLGIGRQLAGSKVPLVGVNLGRLGYMTDIPIQDVKPVLTEIIAGHYEADERTLLDAVVLRDGKVINRALALNDVVVNRSGISGMVELAVKVNDSFMYNQRSDGLINRIRTIRWRPYIASPSCGYFARTDCAPCPLQSTHCLTARCKN
jgi:NAD+ kinase